MREKTEVDHICGTSLCSPRHSATFFVIPKYFRRDIWERFLNSSHSLRSFLMRMIIHLSVHNLRGVPPTVNHCQQILIGYCDWSLHPIASQAVMPWQMSSQTDDCEYARYPKLYG